MTVQFTLLFHFVNPVSQTCVVTVIQKPVSERCVGEHRVLLKVINN